MRNQNTVRRSVISVVATALLLSAFYTQRANADAAQLKAGNPPARCLNAVRKANMIFDQATPTYYAGPTLESLANCREADWLFVAKTRVSRWRTMDDYNYHQIAGIALAGRNLDSLRRWMCRWMMAERQKGAAPAYRVLLACGEKPGTDTSKTVRTTTTTTTTTTTVAPPPPGLTVETPRQEVAGRTYGKYQNEDIFAMATLQFQLRMSLANTKVESVCAVGSDPAVTTFLINREYFRNWDNLFNQSNCTELMYLDEIVKPVEITEYFQIHIVLGKYPQGDQGFINECYATGQEICRTFDLNLVISSSGTNPVSKSLRVSVHIDKRAITRVFLTSL